jgi:hypothetical protein
MTSLLPTYGSIREYKLTKAHELINVLRLTNIEWAERPDNDTDWGRLWLFRGERDEKFCTQASAFRADKARLLSESLGSQGYSSLRMITSSVIKAAWRSLIRNSKPQWGLIPEAQQRVIDVICQAFVEIEAVKNFIYTADKLGYPTPGINTLLRDEWESVSEKYIRELIDLDPNSKGLGIFWLKPEIAFAQHYGIPTRLLDWTENPLAAAFFAAADALEHKKLSKRKRIAIYAINGFSLYDEKLIRRVPTAVYENPYLRAQQGVLVADLLADKTYIETGQYPNIFNSFSLIPGSPHESVLPKKFTLPTSETPELLRLLSIEGITKASLMPTLSNVAETVKLKWFLRKDI